MMRLRTTVRKLALSGGVTLAACLLGGAVHVAPLTAAAVTPTCGGPNVEIATPQAAAIMQDPNVAAAIQGLTDQIEAARQGSQLPSISIAVVHNQDILYAGGFGCANYEQGIAATPATIYHIGSVTKMFVATMLMQMRDAGYVNLDDHVNQYIPQAYFLLPNGQQYSPTFRQLASHSSGLPDAFPMSITTQDDLWKAMERTTVLFQPGAQSSYSDFGYQVLGQSLAVIAGVTYHDWVNQYILNPLSMNSTSYDINSYDPSQIAAPYTQYTVSARGVKTALGNYRNPFPIQGEALSNVLDMAQFIKLQFSGGNSVLAGSTIAEMMQPVISTGTGDNGEGTADIGWFNQGLANGAYTRVAKNGGTDGFTTLLAMVPQAKIGIIAFENLTSDQISGPASEEKLENAILNQLTPLVLASPYQ